MFGFRLNEFWGKGAFWCWLIGFYVAFMPLYVLGLMGMTRRMSHIDNPAYRPRFRSLPLIGAVFIARRYRCCRDLQMVVSHPQPQADCAT